MLPAGYVRDPWTGERKRQFSISQRAARRRRQFHAACTSIAAREVAFRLLDSFDDSGEDKLGREAALFLVAADIVGTDPKAISRFTGISGTRCACFARRAAECGFFVEGRPRMSRYGAERWFGLTWMGDPDCRFWFDADVGLGRCLEEKEDREDLERLRRR